MSRSEVMYFHSRPLEYVVHGEITQHPSDDEHYELCFDWLAQKLGFYGLFLAVGDFSDIGMTGYGRQFSSQYRATAKPADNNQVLFGYRHLKHMRFTDYMNWHIVLNSVIYSEDGSTPEHLRPISSYEERLILKPSWRQSDWHRAASRETHVVQGHTEQLDLSCADIIWCRNQTTRRQLIESGFDEAQVAVKRVPCDT